MTDKLYEGDSMLRECDAVVQQCIACKSGFDIVLDRTVMFPEGGGQLSDVGWIAVLDKQYEISIDHVFSQDNEVFHHGDRQIIPGTRVHVRINWEIRLDRMQQHCGEHMLAYAFWKLYGIHNIGFHMSEHVVAINLDQDITKEQADTAEDFTNHQIWDDRRIHISYVPHTEAKKMPMRKQNDKLTGMLRIVSIDGGDICTCCGTHPTRTGMVGVVKIIRLVQYKEGTRVEFLCGRRALEDVRRKIDYIAEASNMFSTKEENVCECIKRLKSEEMELQEQLRVRTEAAQNFEMKDLVAHAVSDDKGNRIITAVERHYDDKTAKSLLQKMMLLPHAIGIVVYPSDTRIYYLFGLGSGTNGDCRTYISMANLLFNGKGGGRTELCQGSALIAEDWQKKTEILISMVKSGKTT